MKIVHHYLFLFLLLLSLSCHNSKVDTSKYIPYKNKYSINWSDYKSIRPWGNTYAANTYVWYECDVKQINDSLEVLLGTFFVPDSSWYNPEKIDSLLLNHERRHFDLDEAYSRQYRKYLSEWNGKTLNSFKIYFQRGNFQQMHLALLNQYDSETNHSINASEQERWNTKIDSLLNLYKEYEKPVFRIKINGLKN